MPVTISAFGNRIVVTSKPPLVVSCVVQVCPLSWETAIMAALPPTNSGCPGNWPDGKMRVQVT